MKNARQEEIKRNLKGWAGMLKDDPTMDRDGKLVPPVKCRECGWEGPLCKCVSILRPKEENVPVCPKCKSTRIDW
jgi:predicted Zn-ribbon and HTH transcriptional regulator